MVYECEQCGSALPAGVLKCPKCGEGFDEAVPQDAEVPVRGWQPKSKDLGFPSPTSQLESKIPFTPKIVISQEHHPAPPAMGMHTSGPKLQSNGTAPFLQQSRDNTSKPTAKKISPWLILWAIIFLPITLLYLVGLAIAKIWKHPTWSVRTKSILTALVVTAVIMTPVLSNIQDRQNEALQQKAAMAAQSQKQAAQRTEQKRIAGLQSTPQGRARLAAERKQEALAAAEQTHQQKLIAAQTAKEQAAQAQSEAHQQNELQAEQNEKDAVAIYCKKVIDINTQLTDCCQTLGGLFSDPKFNDDEWRLNVAASVVVMNKLSVDGQAISCPVRLQPVQDLYCAALKEYEKASDDLPRALDNKNADEMEACARRMTHGSELMTRATEEAQNINGN